MTSPRRASPRREKVGGMVALLAVAVAVLIGLGTWQVWRLAWKEALIARVDARVAAPASPAPGPSSRHAAAQWPAVTQEASEYRHVTVSGRYRADASTLTKAVTARGPGYWVMSPLDTTRGFTVLVNRGFVPEGAGAPPPVPIGTRTVTGLLRMTEPGGGFLRDNDPGANRWFSRDVAAIARARGLGPVAPYFIDRDAGPESAASEHNTGADAGAVDGPVGGLTIIRFPNNHLVYAITWFTLAAMAAFAIWRLIRRPEPPNR